MWFIGQAAGRGVELAHRRPGSFAPWRRCAQLPIPRIAVASGTPPRPKIIPVKRFNLVGKCSKCYLNEGRDIGRFVTEEIQPLAGIRDTFTIIAFKTFF
jgi:hypothetical protein